MRIIVIRTISLLLIIASCISAQDTATKRGQVVEISDNAFCNYVKSTVDNKEIYAFNSNKEAEDVVSLILKPTGLKPNFVVKVWTEYNAAASFDKAGNRLIFYNPSFIRDAKQSTGTDWGPISIIAHEVGHHLQGHSLKMVLLSEKRKQLASLDKIRSSGSLTSQQKILYLELNNEIDQILRDRRKEELDADNFSGYNLCKLGATLDQALVAMKKLVDDQGSETHPDKQNRLLGIEAGWREAGCSTDKILGRPTKENANTNNAETIADTPKSDDPPTARIPAPQPRLDPLPRPSSSPVVKEENPIPKKPEVILIPTDIILNFQVYHNHASITGNSWASGSITVSRNNQVITYKEIAGDRDPSHSFTTSCQSQYRDLKTDSLQIYNNNGYIVDQLPVLRMKINGKIFKFAVTNGTADQRATNNRMADDALAKIVEVCKL
jgi:hypothetical protein